MSFDPRHDYPEGISPIPDRKVVEPRKKAKKKAKSR